jgi:hypothetical protein
VDPLGDRASRALAATGPAAEEHVADLAGPHQARELVEGATAGGPPASLDATADLAAWVRTSCSAVPASRWQAVASRADSGIQLYDCAGGAVSG